MRWWLTGKWQDRREDDYDEPSSVRLTPWGAVEVFWLRRRLQRLQESGASFMLDPWTPSVDSTEAELQARLDWLIRLDSVFFNLTGCDHDWNACKDAYLKRATDGIHRRCTKAYQEARLPSEDDVCTDISPEEQAYIDARWNDAENRIRELLRG